jgi:sporulation protein YlmC with PRC-barrel domain
MKHKHTLFGGILVIALVLAACGPSAGEMTATNADTIDTTGVAQTPINTLDANSITPTADMEMTNDAMGTQLMTPTGEGTTMPEGTSTMVPEGTTTATANEPLLIRASDMIELDVAGDSNILLGVVNEVLVDDSGAVQYIVVDANPELESSSTAESNLIAVPPDMISVQPGIEQIVFLGNEADLRAHTAVDVELFDNDDDFVIGNEEGTPAATSEFNDLIRVSKYTDFDLRNTEDEDLGEVEDLVIDIHAAQVEHTVVNFGGFLGIGEKAIAVPWNNLTLVITAAATTDNDEPYFVLDVPRETLELAPAIEDIDETLPRWPDTINPTWNTQYDSFWNTAGN